MPIDRQLWLKPLQRDPLPFPCPTCGTGRLRYKTQTRGEHVEVPLFYVTSPENHRKMMRFQDASLNGSFVYMAVCEREECRELVCLCGEHEHKSDDNRGRPTNLFLVLKPKFIWPAPNIFAIPPTCKPIIRDEVRAAFQLFWCDPGACANRIRNAVELVLTDMRVRRFRTIKGERRRLNLHSRIEDVAAKEPALAETLMALKWVGNAGSHPAGQVSKEIVLDAFEILEHVLHERFVQHGKKIAKLSREINRRKGPSKTV